MTFRAGVVRLHAGLVAHTHVDVASKLFRMSSTLSWLMGRSSNAQSILSINACTIIGKSRVMAFPTLTVCVANIVDHKQTILSGCSCVEVSNINQ